MVNEANERLYARARSRSQKALFRSIISRRPGHLLSLQEITKTCAVRDDYDVNNRAVPIRQILGSESRSGDFDRDFNPLHDHNKGRWLSVAEACQRAKKLPPVALIQVDSVYFVRDGHHRISVARALGQTAIEASVEVWQVEGPLPWDESIRERRSKRVRRPDAVERISATLRHTCARLQAHIGDLFDAFGAAHKRPAVPRPDVDGLKI